MIDISDGLGSELAHLAHASRAHVRVDVDTLPCGPGGTWREAVSSGEEYELLVGLSAPVDAREFEATFGVRLTRIGDVADTGGARVEGRHGAIEACVDLAPGHDHFSG
jgi:thiamine-monophosphate kinase